MKVLLDVDTGVDDSIALLYALFNPEIEIVGISAVCGNVEAWLAAENTMKILDLAGAPDIPVAVGAEKPFPLVYYQSHKEKSVKGGHRPQRLPLILFFVGYNTYDTGIRHTESRWNFRSVQYS